MSLATPSETTETGVSQPSRLAASIAILVAGIVGNTTIALMPLLISGMSEYLGFDDVMLGELAAASSFGAAFTTIAALFFLDRTGWPLRRTAFVAMAVYALASMLIPLAFGQVVLLQLAFFISGSASGLIWASCVTAVIMQRNSPRLVSIFFGTPFLIGMVIQPLMPTLYANWGVGSAFDLMGLACLLGFLVMKWFPARAIGAVPSTEDDVAPSKQKRLFWIMVLPVASALLLQYIANTGVWVYFDRIGLLAGHPHQLSANIVALGSGMALVGTALAVVLTPRLRPVGAIVAAGIVAALATLGLLGAQNYIVFGASVFIFNAMITFVTPFYFLLLSRLSISPGKAALVGNLMIMIGFTVGPLPIGRLVNGGDFTLAIYATSTMFVVSVLIVIANAALGKSREVPRSASVIA